MPTRALARVVGVRYTAPVATTPLYDWHVGAGAKMTEFAGWQMPVSYAGAIDEHHLVRRSAGIFDVSHMGRFRVSGPAALDHLQRLVTANLAPVASGGSTYALLCRDDGGVLDDLFLYRLSDHWLVVANAANRETVFRRLSELRPDSGVDLADLSDETAMFAFQGPKAVTLLDRMTGGAAGRIERFGSAALELASVRLIAGRTGYTGEDGIELFLPAGSAQQVWEAVLGEGDHAGIEVGPVGLAARDSLRFEPGFPLYGHELTEEITPLEARLGWACDLDKEFIGRDALVRQLEQGLPRRLATVRMIDRGVPRQGFAVLHEGQRAGHVASGMYAPTVDAYCANVFVPPALAAPGTNMDIEIRDRARAAVVVKRPLYTPAYR